MMVRLLRLEYLVVVLLLIQMVPQFGGADPSNRKFTSSQLLQSEHVPGQMIVRLHGTPGVAAGGASTFLSAKLGSDIESIQPLVTDAAVQLVKLKPSKDLLAALESLRAD